MCVLRCVVLRGIEVRIVIFTVYLCFKDASYDSIDSFVFVYQSISFFLSFCFSFILSFVLFCISSFYI